MKKIAYLFVAFAFFGVIVFSSCKPKTTDPAVETVVEEAVAAPADTMAVDSTTIAQ